MLLRVMLIVGLAAQAQAALPEISIGYEPDPSAASRADDLTRRAKSGLGTRDLMDAANSHAFLHLAARSADPKVVAEALRGMARSWSRGEGKSKRPTINKDFRKVVSQRLGVKDANVLAGALAAARLVAGGSTPDAKVVDRIIALATSGVPAVRLAAFRALHNVRAFQVAKPAKGKTKGKVVAALLTALEAKQAWLVAGALDELAGASFSGLPHRDKVLAATRKLAAHADPGVRGLALLTASRVASAKERADIAKLVRGHFKHKNAFVRGAAADAAAALGERSLLHDLLALLDDAGKAEHMVKGFTAADVKAGEIRLRVEGGRVDAAALRAFKSLSNGKFSYVRGGGAKRDAKRAAAITQAKAWYAKAKSKLPKSR